MLLALVKTLRPRQWVKNLFFVGAPLLFSLHLLDVASVLRAGAAVGLFCLVSGAVYVINDIVDVDKDRRHPIKRNRPIAAGQLPIGVAKAFVACAVPVAVAASFVLDPRFCATIVGYLVLNVAYSLRLKKIAYLDVLMIAAFFIMRVSAGAFAIDVAVSPWLLACTFLLATFLGFGKRAHELAVTAGSAETRAVLSSYDPAILRRILHASSLAVVVVYALYTRSPRTIELLGTDALVWTVPFPVLGIWRFVHLATTRPEAESPTEEMLRDWVFMVNIVAYVVTTALILYLR